MKTTDLKKIIDLFSPINDAISIIEKVATLEQAENEAKMRIEKLRKEGSELEARNRNAQTIADGLINEATARAAALGAAADAEMADVKGKMVATLADAKTKAKLIIEDAEAKAKAAQANATIAAQKVADSAHELADLESKIEKAKVQIAKLLGGN